MHRLAPLLALTLAALAAACSRPAPPAEPLRAVRTAYVAADGETGPDQGLVNAALMSRDQIVSGLSQRSMSVLDGLMRGRRQRDIAAELGISPSAVSQRIRAEGIGVLLAADELLRDL